MRSPHVGLFENPDLHASFRPVDLIRTCPIRQRHGFVKEVPQNDRECRFIIQVIQFFMIKGDAFVVPDRDSVVPVSNSPISVTIVQAKNKM